jgi:hypothetical protein
MFAASKTNSVATVSAPDAQFNYVTMLLHGDGTNGAQNNTFLDSSTNNFSITRNGNPTQGSFSPYGSNWSNYFDGSSALQTPNNANLYLSSSNFTIECWVNLNYNTGGPNIIRTVNGYSFALIQGTTTLLLYLSSNGVSWDITSGSNVGSFTPNTWNHVAIVRNGSTFVCYLNGVAGATVTSASALYQTNGFYIGKETGGGYLNGYVSNARIVVGTAVYTSAFTPSTTPLTAITNTQLLTCQSNRFVDNSTNAYTLTLTGTPSVQRFNPFGTATAYSTSVIGGSGYFAGGTTNYLNTPTSSGFLFTGDFTVEAWFYQTGTGTFGGVFGNYVSNINSNWTLQLGPSGNLTWYYYSAGSSIVSTFKYNQWNHVACVRSGTTLTMYLNGVSVGTATQSGNMGSSTDPFLIGTANTDSITGYISNVRVVNGTAVYTANFTPPTAPVTAISGTSLLTNFTNGAIFDNAMINNLETVGNAQISTSVVKYGTGSMYFDGSGDYLYSPTTTQFNVSKPYTIEFWTYPISVTTVTWISAPSAYFYIETFGTTLFVGDGVTNIISTTPPSTGVWTHFALSYDGTTTRLFYNGTSQATSTTALQSQTLVSWYIGQRYDATRPFNGYIDDLRITKGYARYTANFTPPTAAFPNTGPN